MAYPAPSSAIATTIMRGNRSLDTKPERALRSALHAGGYRFRKHYLIDAAGLRVRPDIVFTRLRIAIFVDGCFWHGCPEHGAKPRANEAFWAAKFARNAARDRLVNERLNAAGWTVLRVWEHETTDESSARIELILNVDRQ
jgi:DNA mismatch endonuclease (patch repair protein)